MAVYATVYGLYGNGCVKQLILATENGKRKRRNESVGSERKKITEKKTEIYCLTGNIDDLAQTTCRYLIHRVAFYYTGCCKN